MHEPTRLDHDFSHRWHVAINRYSESSREDSAADYAAMRFMYEAKEVAEEVPRLILVHRLEREGQLGDVHQQCSHSLPEPVADNHLTCCLGVQCRACPHLLAIDAGELSPEERDVAKAWTCATHIVSEGGDQAREGYILTVSDKMFWQNVYQSLSQGLEE